MAEQIPDLPPFEGPGSRFGRRGDRSLLSLFELVVLLLGLGALAAAAPALTAWWFRSSDHLASNAGNVLGVRPGTLPLKPSGAASASAAPPASGIAAGPDGLDSTGMVLWGRRHRRRSILDNGSPIGVAGAAGAAGAAAAGQSSAQALPGGGITGVGNDDQADKAPGADGSQDWERHLESPKADASATASAGAPAAAAAAADYKGPSPDQVNKEISAARAMTNSFVSYGLALQRSALAQARAAHLISPGLSGGRDYQTGRNGTSAGLGTLVGDPGSGEALLNGADAQGRALTGFGAHSMRDTAPHASAALSNSGGGAPMGFGGGGGSSASLPDAPAAGDTTGTTAGAGSAPGGATAATGSTAGNATGGATGSTTGSPTSGSATGTTAGGTSGTTTGGTTGTTTGGNNGPAPRHPPLIVSGTTVGSTSGSTTGSTTGGTTGTTSGGATGTTSGSTTGTTTGSTTGSTTGTTIGTRTTTLSGGGGGIRSGLGSRMQSY